MERRVSVNAKATSGPEFEAPEGAEPDPTEADWPSDEAFEPEKREGQGDGKGCGPCLYLGPAGERCSREAVAGGFCAKHKPGGRAEALKNPARILAAALGIIALVWPYVNDLVREILRWVHDR